MPTKYIAKPNTFFDPGTEAFLIEPPAHKSAYGYFRGIHYGEMKVELCKFDEFEQIWVEDENDTVRN